MRVLVTRPGEDGTAFAKILVERGIETTIEPLLKINQIDGPALELDKIQAILVTSANGVRALAKRTNRREIPIYAVGDATASTAKSLGFEQIHSAAGNLESLLKLVKDMLKPRDGALLHIAGSSVAGDLISLIKNIGFQCNREVLYEAIAERSLMHSTMAAIKEKKIEIVTLYSPRSAITFVELIRKARLVRSCQKIIAVCLSQAVAEQIKGVAWQKIYVAAEPNQDSLLKLLTGLTDGVEKNGPVNNKTIAGKSKNVTGQDSVMRLQPENTAAPNIAPVHKLRGSAPKTVFITLLCVALLFSASLASKPLWMPLLQAFVPEFFKPSETDIKIRRLKLRLTAIEKTQQAPDLTALKKEKERQKEKLDVTLERLNKLEISISLVKQLIDAVNTNTAKDAAQALKLLSNRLLKLEAQGSKANIERSLRMLPNNPDTVIKRAPNNIGNGKNILINELILSIAQLRELVRKGLSYNNELSVLVNIVKRDPVLNTSLKNSLNQLAKFSREGVPTFQSIKTQFNKHAEKIVHADLVPADGTWIQRTLARLLESIKWRRTDNLVGDGVEAVIARAEQALISQNVAMAIKELSILNGPAGALAKGWVARSTNYIAAEKALTELQTLTVAQILPRK
jgi:uroporphyrinogen-III synthase